MPDLTQQLFSIISKNKVSIHELFTPEFLQKNSVFHSVDQFIQSSGFQISSQEDFEKVPIEDWDAYVQKNSIYQSFKEMKSAATQFWLTREIDKIRE